MAYVLYQEQRVNADQKELYEKRLQSSETQHQAEIAVAQREYAVKLQEAELKLKEAQINQVASENIRASQLAATQVQIAKEEDSTLVNLMSEFSAVSVDLNDRLPCDDREAQAKFNFAKAKFHEAYAFAEAHNLVKKYGNFFFHNAASGWKACATKTSDQIPGL